MNARLDHRHQTRASRGAVPGDRALLTWRRYIPDAVGLAREVDGDSSVSPVRPGRMYLHIRLLVDVSAVPGVVKTTSTS